MDKAEFRLTVLKELVELGEDNYKENTRISSVLEDKAQKTGTVASAFLAVALAFLKPDYFDPGKLTALHLAGLPVKVILVMLIAAIVMLLISTVLALSVVWVRANPTPVLVQDMTNMEKDLFALGTNDLSEEIAESHYRTVANKWESKLEGQVSVIEKKARLLRWCQGSLATAVAIIAIMLTAILVQVYRVAS